MAPRMETPPPRRVFDEAIDPTEWTERNRAIVAKIKSCRAAAPDLFVRCEADAQLAGLLHAADARQALFQGHRMGCAVAQNLRRHLLLHQMHAGEDGLAIEGPGKAGFQGELGRGDEAEAERRGDARLAAGEPQVGATIQPGEKKLS